ncbi:MAG: hypothetical protein Q9192_002197 [Flavoplaca navasiana]
MASPNQARTVILTCSVAAVTALGAMYGAGLKSSRNVAKVTQNKQEAPTEEVLAQLYASRKGLVARKVDLERKIAELESKQRPTNKNAVPEAGG